MTRVLTSTWVRTALVAFALMGISELTGFGDWINGHPVAAPALRTLVILCTGAAGVFLLIAPPRDDPDWKPIRYRGLALFFLTIASLNIAALAGLITPP